MDIHGEDSFGLTRDNGLMFRHNHTHHMYFNDFTVPSSKALKELEEIDALSKHVIMKGLNDDEPSLDPHPSSSSSSSSSIPRHSSLDYTGEPSLKLEEDDELGAFAFFKKPPSTHGNHLSHSVDDMLQPHHTNTTNTTTNTRHDYNGFLQSDPFDMRGGLQCNKPKDSTNGMHAPNLNHNSYNTNNHINNINHHDPGSKHNDNGGLSSAMTMNNSSAIINNINHHINHHISNMSTINNVSNIINNSIHSGYNTITNNINNNININININHQQLTDQHKNNEDMTDTHHDRDPTSMDDKSSIHLINTHNTNNLEFLDDYITTGSNSSSSPDESPLHHDQDHDDEDMESSGGGGGGIRDSTSSLAGALSNAALALVPLPSNPISTPLGNGMHRITSNPGPSHSSAPHPAAHRLHHSTGSLLGSSSGVSIASVVDGSGYHSLTSSCTLVIDNPPVAPSAGHGVDSEANGIPIVLAPGGTTVIDGVTYNNRGYEVCGSLNKFNKPCQRIGRCPFHHDTTSPKKSLPIGVNGEPAPNTTLSTSTNSPNGPVANGTAVNSSLSSNPSATPTERRYLPIKKGPYKSGWKKDEHIRFLKGLQMHGKGSWKEIALIVGTRTPTQIQVHAHRYYLRQQQETKNKRSIHDISLQDLEDMEVQQGIVLPSSVSDSTGSSPHLSPPSPERSHNDIPHLFTPNSHHPPQPSHHHSAPSTPSSHSLISPHHHTTSPPLHHHSHSSPLSHSDGITNNHLSSATLTSPPISAPSSPIVPPISSNFSSLFPGSATSSLSNTLPGFPMMSPFPMTSSFSSYHTPTSWFSTPPPSSATSSSLYSINQMSNLNSMTINMSGLGDVDGLHLPSHADHKLMSPLTSSFSNMSDDDYEDDIGVNVGVNANGHIHDEDDEFHSDDD